MTTGVRERKLKAMGGWLVPAVVVLLAVSVFLLYIGRGTRTGANPPVQNQSALVGKPAPEIAGVAFDGSPVDLARLRGKVVMINFFASWCAECRAEIPDIQRTYTAKQVAGFEVLGVDAWENGDGRSFLASLGGTYPAVPDPQPAANLPGPIAAAYGLGTEALPVSVFVDRAGRVHQVFPGRIDAGNIGDELRQLGIS